MHKKIFSLFLTAASILVMTSAVITASAAEYIYNQDFEAYKEESALSGDDYHVGGTAAPVVVENPYGEGMVLKYTTTSASYLYRINNKQPVENLGGKRFVYEFHTTGSETGSIYAQFYTGMNENDAYNRGTNFKVITAKEGEILLNNNGTDEEYGSYTPGEWMILKVVVYEENGSLVYDAVKQSPSGDFEILAQAVKFTEAFSNAFKTKGNLRVRIMVTGGTKNEEVYLDNTRIYIPPKASVTDAAVAGNLKVGTKLSLDFKLVDTYNDGDCSLIQWYRTVGETDTPIEGETGREYLIQEDDYGNSLKVVITPKTAVMPEGETVEIVVGVVNLKAGAKPVASELKIIGDAIVGKTVKADYIYSSEDNIDPSDKTEIIWYKVTEGDDAVIGKGDSIEIPVEAEDSYIYYTVQPVDVQETYGDVYLSTEVYVPLRPYVKFNNITLFKGFGSVKSEISGLKSGTVTVRIPFTLEKSTTKGALIEAKLFAGDELIGTAFTEISKLINGNNGEFTCGFYIPDGKTCHIEIGAYEAADEKRIISGSTTIFR